MKKLEISTINFNGNPFYFRDGTSDVLLIQLNLLSEDISKRDYLFPVEIKPKIIFDIGANIGTTALLLDHIYPNSTIYCFEPDEENFELLEKNVEKYPNIIPLKYGLSDRDEEIELYDSTDELNYGGLSTIKKGDSIPRTKIQVKNSRDICHNLNISNIDLIKIDCEGAEYSILSSIPKTILEKVQWIEGELHGEKEFETLATLNESFKLQFTKFFGDVVWQFKAINNEVLNRLKNEAK